MIRSLPVLPPKSTTNEPLTQNQIAKHFTGRDYLSYSAVSTYQRCPLRYYFSYVEGLAGAHRARRGAWPRVARI
jgi:hypothetical protein